MVQFYFITQAQYNSATKNAEALYFTTDTLRIYKGAFLYADVKDQLELIEALQTAIGQIPNVDVTKFVLRSDTEGCYDLLYNGTVVSNNIKLNGWDAFKEAFEEHTTTITSSSALGHIKTGYTTSGKNYAVKVDADGDAYVNVPWTDKNDNTTYSIKTTSSTTQGTVSLDASSGTDTAVNFKGAGTVTVTSDANGNVTITGSNSAQSDWAENDPSQDSYVKNRTHWVDYGDETCLIPHQSFDYPYGESSSTGYTYLTVDSTVELSLDKTYKVIYNGVTYENCKCKEGFSSGGSPAIVVPVGSDQHQTDAVCITRDGDAQYRVDVGYNVISQTDSDGNRTIDVYEVSETVHQLDEKYISDTIARKSEVDEVSNRVAAIENGSSGGGSGSNSPANEVILTQEEYDALGNEKYTNGVTYYVSDANIDPNINASDIAYAGNVEATNVKEAIDELAIGTLRYTVVRSNFMFTIGSAENNFHDVTSLVGRYDPKAVIPVVLSVGHINMATVGKNGDNWYLSYINKGSVSENLIVDLIILF